MARVVERLTEDASDRKRIEQAVMKWIGMGTSVSSLTHFLNNNEGMAVSKAMVQGAVNRLVKAGKLRLDPERTPKLYLPVKEALDEATYHSKSGKFTNPKAAHTVTKGGERFKVVRQLRRMKPPQKMKPDLGLDDEKSAPKPKAAPKKTAAEAVEEAKAKAALAMVLSHSSGWVPVHSIAPEPLREATTDFKLGRKLKTNKAIEVTDMRKGDAIGKVTLPKGTSINLIKWTGGGFIYGKVTAGKFKDMPVWVQPDDLERKRKVHMGNTGVLTKAVRAKVVEVPHWLKKEDEVRVGETISLPKGAEGNVEGLAKGRKLAIFRVLGNVPEKYEEVVVEVSLDDLENHPDYSYLFTYEGRDDGQGEPLTEEMILAELQVVESLIDGYSEGDDARAISEAIGEKLAGIFRGIRQRVSTMSEKVMRALGRVYQKLMAKLPGTAQSAVERQVNRYASQVQRAIGALSDDAIQDVVRESIRKAIKDGLIPPPESASATEIAKAFADKDKILVKMIQRGIEDSLEHTKRRVANIVTGADKEVASKTTLALQALKSYGVGMSASAVFGIIDNAGMLVGMDQVEGAVQSMGYSAQVAAGLGNTFSDAVGALLGGAVAFALWKILGIKGEGTTAQATIGVTVGCLIPIAIKLAIAAMTGGVA